MRLRPSLLLVPVIVLGLAACAPERPPGFEPTFPVPGTATPAPTGTTGPTDPSATPTAPTTSAAPSDPGEAFSIACDELTSLDVMYEFNPNLALLDDRAPSRGTLGAEAVAAGGTYCFWSNSTGTTVEVSVAKLSGEATAAKIAGLSGAVDTYGGQGFFSGGTAQVFVDGYWLAAVSPDGFGEPEDALPIVEAALGAL